MNRPDNIFTLADYSPRVLGEKHHNHIRLYRSLEEEARIHAVYQDVQRDLRIMRAQAFVKWLAVLVAYATLALFSFQIGRGL